MFSFLWFCQICCEGLRTWCGFCAAGFGGLGTLCLLPQLSHPSPQSSRMIGEEATFELSYLRHTVKAACTDAMNLEMMKRRGGDLNVTWNRYQTDSHPSKVNESWILFLTQLSNAQYPSLASTSAAVKDLNLIAQLSLFLSTLCDCYLSTIPLPRAIESNCCKNSSFRHDC